MGIAALAFVLVIANAVGITHFGTEVMVAAIIIGVIGLIFGGFNEAVKDETARKNARDYWLNRGSGARDKRYDDRSRRR